MPGPLNDVVTTLLDGVRAINNLSNTISNSVFSIPFGLNALSSEVYAEVDWTPTVTFATPGDLAVVYSTASGGRQARVTKIGREVFAQFSIVTTTFTFTTSSGAFQITGLPYSANSDYRGSGIFAVIGGITAFSAGYSFVNPVILGPAPNTIVIAQNGSGVNTISANSTTNFTTGTNLQLRGQMTFTTA